MEAGKDVDMLSDLENKRALRNSHYKEFDLDCGCLLGQGVKKMCTSGVQKNQSKRAEKTNIPQSLK